MNYNKKMEEMKGVKVFAGVDVGKEKHFMSLIGEDGLVKNTGICISNSLKGFEKMVGMLKSTGTEKEVVVGMEPTGHYWKALGYYLKEKGYMIYLVNPYHVKLSKEMRDNSQRKTDKKDSELIAHLVREGKFLNSRLLDGNYEELRRLTTARERMVQEIVRCRIRLISILDEYLPEYERCFCKITAKTSLKLLNKYGIKGLREKSVALEVVKDIVLGSRHKIPKERALEILGKLENTIGLKEGLTGAEIELKIWLEELEGYLNKLSNIEKEIKKVLDSTEEAKYLLSIKGVGYITAAIVLGQTGSFRSFNNAKQLEKFAGLDLVERSSGKRVGGKRISKRGRKLLRHGLYRVAIVAIARCKEFKALYEYKVNILKKNKMIAVTDITVKMLRIMFAVVKNKTMYDGNLVLKAIAYS